MHVLSHVLLWTVACQAPLSMGFPRQKYWSGLPCPSPGDLPNPGIEPRSPALQADSLPSEPTGKPTSGQENFPAVIKSPLGAQAILLSTQKSQSLLLFSTISALGDKAGQNVLSSLGGWCDSIQMPVPASLIQLLSSPVPRSWR